MANKLVQKTTLALSAFALALSINSWAAQNKTSALDQSSYGEIFIEEKRETPVLPWELGLTYGYELSNPYLYTHSLNMTALHTVGNSPHNRFFKAGLSVSKYFSYESDLLTGVGKSLPGDTRIQAIHQDFSTYGLGELTPFSGKISFFDHTPVDLDLRLRLGAGLVIYSDEINPSVLWSIRPGVFINKNISIRTGIGQEWESPFDPKKRLSRLVGEAGVSVHF